MARLHTGRDKVLSFYRSYHGNTGAAITSTGDPRRWPNEYATGHVHFFGPYLYRSSFWAEHGGRGMPARARASRAGHPVRGPGHDRRDPDRDHRRHRGRARAAARLPGRRARAGDKYGIVWIADEVMCGFGRAGSWFAFEPARRGAGPDHLRQGLQLGLRADRRRDHLRSDRGDLRRAGVPRRPHLLRASAGQRLDRGDHRRDARRGHRRERGQDRNADPRARPGRAGQPASGDRRGPRARRVLGARPGVEPARPGPCSRRTAARRRR